jgi:molecular chaperone GrpE
MSPEERCSEIPQEPEIRRKTMANAEEPQSDRPELTSTPSEAASPEANANGNIPGEQAVETVPSLEQMLKKAELDAEEHHDAWLRAKADAENIRKRAQIDISNAHKYAIEKFSTELLPVLDSLEAALTVENASVESFKNGMDLTLRQLISAFEKFNLKQINPQKGERFDPHLHQAMCIVDSDAPPNTVVQVMQKGYVLNDRVIRPALVSVSKAKEA